MGSTVVFCLDVQADYSHLEADNIAKYKLGKQVGVQQPGFQTTSR